MPHEWNSIWVVTQDELVPKFFLKERTLHKTIDRYKDKPYGIKKVQSGGNGRQMLVSYDSLPEHIKSGPNGIPDPRKLSHLLEMFYRIDTDAVRFYTQEYKFDDGSYLSLQHQEEYITNASVLRACTLLKSARENERRSKGGSLKGIMATVCSDAASFNKTLKAKHDVEHTLPSSEKRFKEVFKQFLNGDGKAFNYRCLISAKLKNANAKKVTDQVVSLLNDMFAGTGKKPTRTEISRQFDAFLAGYLEIVSEETGEVYDPKDFKKLSDATIVNYLGLWENRIGTYTKRSGERLRDMERFKPYHRFKRPEHAGRIISIDDRQPPFEYANGQRAWFYNAIDLGSGAFTCWVYGKSKDGIIVDFYRQLVRNYSEWGFNLPLELECEASLNSSFTGTFLRPGAMFDHVRIEANNPRGKRIEREFGYLRYNIEKEHLGWLARPFAKSEANQSGPEKKIQLPYTQIIEQSLQDIEDWNNSPHPVHKNITRWEFFLENQTPETKPTNWKAILPSLGYYTKSSCNLGVIRLQGKEFMLGDNGEIYLGGKLINLMKQIEGRTIDVYWLDDNKGEVLKAIVFMGDTCICEAIERPVPPRSITERTPKDNADFELVSAYVASVEGFRRQQKNSINDVLIIDNRPKTLNRKFEMPNNKRYEAREDQPAEILPSLPDEDEQFPEEQQQQSFVRRLKDRF